MNIVSLIGRLGQDPEVRYTDSGKAVAKLNLAVNERYGETEKTYWFTVLAWNGLAEVVGQYLKKGSRVAVTGRLTQRSYETQEGDKRSVVEIMANTIDFLDPRQELKSVETDEDIPF